MSKVFHSFVLDPLQDTFDSVEPHIEIFHGRAKGDPYKVVAGGTEEITPVRRIDFKEYA